MTKDDPIARMLKEGAPASSWRRATIDPSQVTCSIGRPLTEEEFKKLCAERGMTPQIHRVDSKKK